MEARTVLRMTKSKPLMSLLVLLAALSILAACSSQPPPEPAPADQTQDADPSAVPEDVPAASLYVIATGDTFVPMVVSLGFTADEASLLADACSKKYDLGKLRAGRKIYYLADPDGHLAYFRLEVDDDSYLEAACTEDGYQARNVRLEYKIDQEVKSLEIRDCLYCDAEREGWDVGIMDQLANTIFAWTIDFDSDLRKGDRFTVLVERMTADNEFKKHGRVLAATAKVEGREYSAFWFKTPEGGNYYDKDGKALHKMFLRTPLNFTRISSGFTLRRMHPILRVVRPHLGIDYAAPAGTPIRAVANGVITKAGRNGGFGNYIEIRHSGSCSTGYGHLQGFARGIESGCKVKQGQTIGFVGSTGMATGPHLDFRMIENKQFVNPLLVKSIEGEPLSQKYLAEYKRSVSAALAPILLQEGVAAGAQPRAGRGDGG